MNLAKILALAIVTIVLAGCSSSRYANQMEAYNSPPMVVDEDAALIALRDEESRLINQRDHGPLIVPFDYAFERNTIIIDTDERKLFVLDGRGSAVVFPIAVGQEGFAWSGEAMVGEKKLNPTWTPPAEMIERRPELEEWRTGMPGGPNNPLGVAAIYLHDEGGNDTMYRIHGTNAPETIGTAASSGCIRMYNQHVSWLYQRIRLGSRVIVTSSERDDVATKSDFDGDAEVAYDVDESDYE